MGLRDLMNPSNSSGCMAASLVTRWAGGRARIGAMEARSKAGMASVGCAAMSVSAEGLMEGCAEAGAMDGMLGLLPEPWSMVGASAVIMVPSEASCLLGC